MPQDPRTTKPLPAIGPWIVVGSAGAPAFQNSWVDSPGFGFEPQFRLDRRTNRVEVRGGMQSGTMLTTIWTMPVGLRPTEDTYIEAVVQHSTEGAGVFCVLRVAPSGAITGDAPEPITSPIIIADGTYPLDP